MIVGDPMQLSHVTSLSRTTRFVISDVNSASMILSWNVSATLNLINVHLANTSPNVGSRVIASVNSQPCPPVDCRLRSEDVLTKAPDCC